MIIKEFKGFSIRNGPYGPYIFKDRKFISIPKDKDPEKLSHKECLYRNIIQSNLKEYQDIWNQTDQIWHLKPIKFEYMNLWKSNQEKNMLYQRGSALQEKNLSNFLRMLYVSIPHESFDNINSDILLLINQDRKLLKVGLN